MTALNFPSSPALNDTFTVAGRTWQWDGTAWLAVLGSLNASLNSIAALSGTSGYLKKTGANTWSLDTTLAYLALSGGTVTGAVEINTGTTGGASLTITGTSSISGAQVLLQGNGATTPNKYLRSKNGVMEILNSDGTLAIFSLTDAGALTLQRELSSYSSSASALNGVSGGSGGWGGSFQNTDNSGNVQFLAAGSTSTNRIFSGKNAGTEKVYADVTGNLYSMHYTEGVNTANSGSAFTIDLANGSVQNVTLTASCTFTMPTATAGKSFVMYLKTGAGSFTASFTNVKWAGGTAPTITTTGARMDMLSFFADGTNWYGVVGGQVYTP